MAVVEARGGSTGKARRVGKGVFAGPSAFFKIFERRLIPNRSLQTDNTTRISILTLTLTCGMPCRSRPLATVDGSSEKTGIRSWETTSLVSLSISSPWRGPDSLGSAGQPARKRRAFPPARARHPLLGRIPHRGMPPPRSSPRIRNRRSPSGATLGRARFGINAGRW